MNPFWEDVLRGAIVTWPGVAVSAWIATRHVKQHIDRQTTRQTGDITSTARDITDEQTRVLLAPRHWWQRRA